MTSEQEKIPQEFWQGIREFNEQEFYKCHDTLEGLWLEAVNLNELFIKGFYK